MSIVASDGLSRNNEFCGICQDIYDAENPAYSIHPSENDPVSHLFHKTCAFKWFKQKATCPLCNKVILIEAAKTGNKSLIQELFAKSVITDEHLDEAIREAKANNHSECEMLLEESKNIKELILNAALNNKTDSLKEYLNNHFVHPYIREKAACVAAEKGHKECLQLLLSNGSVSDDTKTIIAMLALSGGTVTKFIQTPNNENESFILPVLPPVEFRRSELGKSHQGCLEVLLAQGPLPDKANDLAAILAAATGNFDALASLLYSRPISNENMRGNALVLAASKYYERISPDRFLSEIMSAPPPRTGISKFWFHTFHRGSPLPDVSNRFSNFYLLTELQRSKLKRATENYQNCLGLLLNDGSIPKFHQIVALKAATTLTGKSAAAILKPIDYSIDEKDQKIIEGLAQTYDYFKTDTKVRVLQMLGTQTAQIGLFFAANWALDYFKSYVYSMPFGESPWHEASLNPAGTYCPNPFGKI